jgi:uncharacterized RDD family membrane protein YckC
VDEAFAVRDFPAGVRDSDDIFEGIFAPEPAVPAGGPSQREDISLLPEEGVGSPFSPEGGDFPEPPESVPAPREPEAPPVAQADAPPAEPEPEPPAREDATPFVIDLEDNYAESSFQALLEGPPRQGEPAWVEPEETRILPVQDELPFPESPQAEEGEEETPEGVAPFVRPPFLRRLAAFAVDSLIILALVGAFVLGAAAAFYLKGLSVGWIVTSFWPGQALVPFLLLGILVSAVYHVTWIWQTGGTPGKRMAGLEVRTVAGEAPNLPTSLVRWLGSLVSALPFGLGFLWAGFQPRGRGWHDLWAGTVVRLRGT